MPVPRSRRSVLLLSAALLSLPAGRAAAAPAARAGDAYDALRGAWRELLLGSGFQPSEAPFAGKLALLGNRAAAHRSTLAAANGSLWPDLPLTASASITGSHTRLATMAQAYAQPGTGLTGDPGVADAVLVGLGHLHDQVYNAATSPFGNWWDFQIGSPQALLDTVTVLYDRLPAARLADHLAAVDRFVPDSCVGSYTGTSTGANRVDLCRSLALRGILGKDPAKIALARDALSPSSPSSPRATASTRTGPSSSTPGCPTPARTERCCSAASPGCSHCWTDRRGPSPTRPGSSSTTPWSGRSPRSSTTA